MNLHVILPLAGLAVMVLGGLLYVVYELSDLGDDGLADFGDDDDF